MQTRTLDFCSVKKKKNVFTWICNKACKKNMPYTLKLWNTMWPFNVVIKWISRKMLWYVVGWVVDEN